MRSMSLGGTPGPSSNTSITAATAPHLQGSGLGLSIAKGLTEAMGGEISAHARDDGRSGLCVVISLPERVEHG